LKSARMATSLAELDEIQREADETMQAVLVDRGVRNSGAHALHLVSLALDQTRRAIEERRQALSANNVGRVIEFPVARNAPPPSA